MSLVGKVAIVRHPFMHSFFQIAHITDETEKTVKVRGWREYHKAWEEYDSRRAKRGLVVQIIGDVATVDVAATAAVLEQIEQARKERTLAVNLAYMDAIKGLANAD